MKKNCCCIYIVIVEIVFYIYLVIGSLQNSLFVEYGVLFKPEGILEQRNSGMLSTILLPEGTQLFHVRWIGTDVEKQNVMYCHSKCLSYKEQIPRKLQRFW